MNNYSKGLYRDVLKNGAALAPSKSGREPGCCIPVTRPKAAGESGEHASTPTARGAQTESEERSSGTLRYPRPPRAPPGVRGSIAPAASRRTAHPGSTSPAARAPEGEVSLPPAAAAAHAPPGSRRVPQPAPGGRGHRRRASGESGAADGSRNRDLSPRAGNKSRVRTSGRDLPRLREGERGGGGERLSRPPDSAPPGGSTGPAGRRGAEGPRSWAKGIRRARLEASPAQLAPKRSFGGWDTVREGTPKRRGGPRTAKERIRFPGRRSRPPHPCGHGAGTCRRGCSSARSLSASPARRSAPSPPSRQSARWTPPPETGSAREPARIPWAAPGTVPPPPAAGPAFHRAPGLSVRPQKARGLLLRLSGLVAARRPCK
ncbi:collagen alpha-1(I) chain-like [Ursus arctos]|uniref:collagen alpha-1(I) chain-like n=1 Tax=Ursus arctos TaxID=9644 RepID=UPI002546B049|nr:collagen alpha-1(I) chain-like [Ursus arctos]